MAPGLLTPHIPSLQLTLEAVLHRSAANPQQRQLLLCHAGLLLDLIKSLVVFAHMTPSVQQLCDNLVSITAQATAVSLVEKATECIVVIVMLDDHGDA